MTMRANLAQLCFTRLSSASSAAPANSPTMRGTIERSATWAGTETSTANIQRYDPLLDAVGLLDRLLTELAQLEDERDYWSATREAQVATGVMAFHSSDTIADGMEPRCPGRRR